MNFSALFDLFHQLLVYIHRINKEGRAAGVLENFAEGHKYAEHSLRKFVRNKTPEIMPSINKFFTDPKWSSGPISIIMWWNHWSMLALCFYWVESKLFEWSIWYVCALETLIRGLLLTLYFSLQCIMSNSSWIISLTLLDSLHMICLLDQASCFLGFLGLGCILIVSHLL